MYGMQLDLNPRVNVINNLNRKENKMNILELSDEQTGKLKQGDK